MRLSTISYAILGLLDLRDWSAYELAQQADRSLAFVWPVSETQLYAEPKRLAEQRLITINHAPAGPRRSRQVYSITDKGRHELRRWLASPPAQPRWQIEALLRCLFATAGTKDDLLGALEATREASAAAYDQGMKMVYDYQAGDNPFPERLHVNILWMGFVRDQLRLVLQWIEFAANEVRQWEDAHTGGDRSHIDQLLQEFFKSDDREASVRR